MSTQRTGIFMARVAILGATLAAAPNTEAAALQLAPPPTTHVVGHGTAKSCTSAAVVKAVAKGGRISFDCGPKPVTITMKRTAKLVNTSHKVVIDGGGRVTLSGDGERRILYLNTCDKAQTWTTSHCQDQRWPKLVVKNLRLVRGNAKASQNDPHAFGGGGGAIFDEGGQLDVNHTQFSNNRCHRTGPDLGGAAIRALEQWHGRAVQISDDTFRGGRCSNGSALSSIGVSWIVRDSVFRHNVATGHGANPSRRHTPGGGSGGAIYCDGDTYFLRLIHTTIAHNVANEGGGAVFFVSNDNTGTMTIRHSTLHHNPSKRFETAGYPGIFFQSHGHHPKVVHSTID
jgi:hypothetical protein